MTVVKWSLLSSLLALMLSAAALPAVTYGQGGTGRVPAGTPAPSKRSPRKRPPGSSASAAGPRRAPQIEMVVVPDGTFMMGSPEAEVGRSNDEGPRHSVTVQTFGLGKYEVTQAQWRAVMGSNPSHIKGDRRPVGNVSWEQAVEFCRRLSRMTGRAYRLPSEAEWEYAARAGTTTPYAFGQTLNRAQALFEWERPYDLLRSRESYKWAPADVGSFPPNAFGLHDMHGNAWEWCEDTYHSDYTGAPTDGSAWITGGAAERVVRGGSGDSPAVYCRSAYRDKEPADSRRSSLGFRVAMTAPAARVASHAAWPFARAR